LSQAELASQLGVNESTVADWEAGRNRPIRRSWRLLRGFFPGLDG
ncbi:MAG: helix-turn-helix domain-containing protein, partial [Deltaproteobacteria bacterium]|nr:helix-turn-helix domain-containing protein [Deltaproteobacteria bacterium]